jgi:hypothetical protein
LNVLEAGTCQGYNEESWTPVGITDTFSVDDQRIYLYFYLETSVEITLVYRWYHSNTLVYAHQDSLNTEGYHFSWISPGEGEQFLAGDHRVEIWMGDSMLETTEFRIEE